MVLLKQVASENAGQFIVAGDNMSERHYGNWLVRCSLGNAIAMMNTITNLQSGTEVTSLIARMKASPWRALVQGQAFYIAMYLAYAEMVLNLPQQVIAEINIGFLEELKDLLTPKKESIDTKVQRYFHRRTQDYRLAIKEELDAKINQGAFIFTGGPTCDVLIRSLIKQYSIDPTKPDVFDAMDILRLQALFGHQPEKFMRMLKDEIRISYQAF